MRVQEVRKQIRQTINALIDLDKELGYVKSELKTQPRPKPKTQREGKEVEAMYDEENKTFTMDIEESEIDKTFLKYLLESLGLPKDTTVIFKTESKRKGDLQ